MPKWSGGINSVVHLVPNGTISAQTDNYSQRWQHRQGDSKQDRLPKKPLKEVRTKYC